MVISAVLGASPARALNKAPVVTWSTNGRVSAIVRLGNRIYLGGSFTEVRSPTGTTVPRAYLAALNATTGAVDPDWDPSANDIIEDMAVAPDGDRVYAVGLFTSIGGVSRRRIAALDPVSGSAVPGWKANASGGLVRAVAAVGTRVYAGGNFSQITDSVATHARTRLVAIDAGTGNVDPAWTPSANNDVRALEPSPDGQRVFLGGDFSTISGTTHTRLAAVNAVSGAVDASFTADAESTVFDVTATATSVYAAVGGPGGWCSSFAAGSGTLNWRVFANGNLQAVAVVGSQLYCGGHFQTFSGQDRSRLGAVDAATGALLPFAPRVNSALGIFALTPGSGSQLYAGGDFTKISGVFQQGFAKFVE